MTICPQCRSHLVRARSPLGIMYVCPRCQGRAVSIAVLRRTWPRQLSQRLWLQVKSGGGAPGKPCPSCQKTMVEVVPPAEDVRVALDVCPRCQFIWFDRREFEQLPKARPEPPKPERTKQLPLKVREQIAMAQLKQLEEQAEGPEFGGQPPDELWQYIPGMLGLPVEYNNKPLDRVPWVTLGLALLLAITYAATAANLQAVVQQWGMIPAEAMRHGGLTFLTSSLLHGGFFHLLGNTYFLLVFGDNVEDYLGTWRYWLMILVAMIGGHLLHIAGDPRSAVPCIGASGGISAVIVFYALKFPEARLGILFRYFVHFRWVHFPAWAGLAMWAALQALIITQQLLGVGHVSGLAHLGGAIVGLLAWMLWREGVGVPRESKRAADAASQP